ncbi:phage tail tape measure protein [Desulfosporosinus nitroreducens]|uniref:phage tail tape measure protein n=1 Tax=Desulfosporosinus nitroreducens TaxID=2018668 RepID=UPI00207CF660|nr:phage tail tape measure protein [Desulfosporosinus nitroreducens]MCO1599752.1 phage tail tape measure protein [Desulfosporosinus nitroreducens]
MTTREIRTTLALDGEQQFKREMQAAARELRVLGSEMRANTASFGDNAGSMEALTSRSSIYERQIAQQRENVAALTRAVEESAQMYGEADRRTDGYRIQLNNTLAALRNTERQLAQTNEEIENYSRSTIQSALDSEEMQRAQEELGKTLDVIKGAAMAAAGAIAGAFAGAAYFSDESKQAMNSLQAQTGATTEEMSKLKETATEIYTDNFGESIKDVADSMAVVTQTTKQTGDELKKTTEQALLMRDTFGFEVTESINTVNSLMAAFGITSEQAYTLLAQGAQQGANKNGDLIDVMNEYAPHFAQLGLSAEEFTDTLIQGAASGAFQIDKVGDAIKEFGIRSKDGSDASAAGFKALGLNAEEMFEAFAKGGPGAEKAFQEVIKSLGDMKNPLAQNQAGVALFGTMFEDLGVDAIKALGDIEDYAKIDANTLAQINAVKYDDIGAALEGLKRQLITDLAGPIGDELTPRIGEMIEKVKEFDMTPVIDALTWILDNAGTIAALAVGIGAGMATWNVVSTITAVVDAIKVWRIATQNVAIAQAALNLVMDANPIGIIITAVAGLVAGLVVLWNTNEGFRTAVIGMWETIKTTVGAVGEWLTNFFTVSIPEAITTAIDWVSQLPANIGTFFGEIPGIVSEFLSGAITSITEFGGNIINWVTTEIPKFVGNFMTFLGELPGKIGYALGFALGSIVKFGVDAVSWVMTEVPKFIRGIIMFYAELPGKIAELLKEALDKLTDWGSSAASWVATELPKLINTIITFFSQLPGKIKTQLSMVLTDLVTWSSNMLTTVGIQIPKITSSIVSFFSELPGDIFDIGVNIVEGLWSGVNSMVSWLEGKVRSFARGIIDGMKDALGIHSPSRVMRDEVGLMVGAGMAEGIDKSILDVQSAMSRLNRNLVAEAQISTNTNNVVGNPAIKGVSSGGRGSTIIKVINQGTIVGSGGMSEFAKMVSREIGGAFGLSTGGAF